MTGFFDEDKPNKVIGIVGSRRRDTKADHLKCIEAFLGEYRQGDTIGVANLIPL